MSSSTGTNKFGGFNNNQIHLLAMMMKHAKTMPEIDWEGVAQDMGSLTVQAAQERWRGMGLEPGSAQKGTKGAAAQGPATAEEQPVSGVQDNNSQVGSTAEKGLNTFLPLLPLDK